MIFKSGRTNHPHISLLLSTRLSRACVLCSKLVVNLGWCEVFTYIYPSITFCSICIHMDRTAAILSAPEQLLSFKIKTREVLHHGLWNARHHDIILIRWERSRQYQNNPISTFEPYSLMAKGSRSCVPDAGHGWDGVCEVFTSRSPLDSPLE